MLRREIECSPRSMTTPSIPSAGKVSVSPSISGVSSSSGSVGSMQSGVGGVVVLAVDDEERAVPARSGEETGHHVAQLADTLAERAVARALPVERPVDHERPPFH